MTDEQINAAIAEACGWTEIGECENGGFRLRGLPSDRFEAHRKPIPNYCTDLNAMHKAEKVLAPKNWDRFSEKCGITTITSQMAMFRKQYTQQPGNAQRHS
jgi:hypothetical protein